MRLLLTILAVLALPGAALAQFPPQVMRGPVVAPNQSNNGFHGITVSGSASTSVPATRARVTLMLFARTPSINSETVQPIVDALTKAGVPADHVILPPDLGSSARVQNTTITVTVDHPTIEQMRAGIAAVGAAVDAGTNGISVGNAQVWLDADDCSETTELVRSEAIKNAHTKAEQTAKDLQVHVGNVLNVLSNDQLNSTGGCSTQYAFGNMNLVTPKDYVSIPVTAFVTITYAIKY